MAILKDLIVHGSSRFLNKIYAEELETSAFEAESAIIKKLKADDVTVVGLLDVQGEMHTNSWTNSNIATIDGSFYITPTIGSDSGNIVFSSVNVASLTGNFTGVDSLYIGGSSSGSTVQWTSGSKVLLTGEVEVNGQWLPLGTLLGTLSANAQTSSIGLKELKDNRHNDSSIIIDIRNAIGSTSLDYRNLKISLYQRKDGADSKPLGIYMTAMGTNGKTFIDIYGGVNSTTTAGSSGGFADPNLRIGNLSGLGAVEGTTPTGWGIYTTNGYFKGVIVSSAGKIGGFDIGTTYIKNTKTSYSETTNNGVWVGTDGIGLGKGLFYVTNAGALTAKSGSIAGWSFNTSSLYKTNATPGYNTSTMVISTGTASTKAIGGSDTTSKNWMISAGTGFGVTTAGVLYANNVHISGEITATSGTIGGASITNGVLLVGDANISGQISASHIDASSITIGSLSGADNYALKEEVPTTVAELTDSGSYLTTSVASNTYATQTNLNNEINARKAVYGTSSTDAGTATKVVTCSNFALYTGASVTVTFSKTNTSSAPQLNVNSTGAKPIKSYTGANLTEGEYKWAAGASITFTYDGTNWRMQDGGALQAKIDAASSASTASSQAGVATQQATNATSAKTAAESAKTAAESAKTAAQSAKTAAETASSQASSAKDTAVSAKNDAVSAKADAQTAAGNASQSATDAANSATAAAEVMGGFTILWNYSAFATSDNGEGYLCAFDPATGTKSDANGWVKWNGVKRTITKQMINPNAVLPYNIPIYVVCRLSSTTATTGTNYMVWYNSGWKYAAMPTPSAVGGSWTWADGTDIILGKFVETASEAALTEYEIYNPPYTSKQITTNVVTAQSASASAASAAQTATTYITNIDSNKGITIKPADASGNDYLQMNSSAINFYRNNVETLKIEDSAIRVGKLGNSLRNVYITDSAVQIRNNTSVLAEYGDSIKLYQPTTTTVAVEISSTGASFTGNVTATSLSTGTKTASTTGKGTYIDGSGNIYVGNGSTNNFTVTNTGTITATGANLLTATIGNATNKITIGTGTSGHSSIRYGMTTWADTTNNGFYIGTDGIALGKGAFKVTAAGALTATSGSISGGIVTSGIDAGNITAGTLSADRIGANSIDASKINVSSISIGNLSGVSNYAQKTDVAQAIDNIEVGGRNLLKNSNVVLNDITNYIVGGVVTQTLPTGTVITLSVQIDADDVSWKSSGSKLRMGVASSIVKDSGGNQYLEVWAAQTGHSGTGIVKTFDTSFHGRIKCTYTLQGELTIGKNFSLYIQDIASGTVQISKPKLEIGNKATDWTPAPEDTQESINSVSTVANTALSQSSWYATCPTPGGTTEKVATITPATTAFILTEGATVNVKFDAKNTGAVGSITLNVNGTGAKNIKYINNNAISNIPGTDYIAAGRTYQFVYDGTYWVIQNLNYNTNTNTIGTLGATKLIAGTNVSNASATTVYRYTLIMKKTIGDSPTWVSLVTSSSTGTSKTRYTGGFYPDEIFYMSTNVSKSPYGYSTGASTGDSYAALGFDLRYSTNCGSTLVIGKPVYLVGTINSLDGLFYLDSTWWTQTEPTIEDGKTYIYLGKAYSATNVYLVEKNPLMRFYQGAFRTEEQIAGMTATSYITYIDANNGIQVHNSDDLTDYIQINSDAISIYRGDPQQLGLSMETLRIEDDNIRIGKVGQQNLLLKENGVFIRNNDKDSLVINANELSYMLQNGQKLFSVKKSVFSQTQTGDGSTKTFTSSSNCYVTDLQQLKINDVVITQGYSASINNGICTVVFQTAPANNASIIFSFVVNYYITEEVFISDGTEYEINKTSIGVLKVYIDDVETSNYTVSQNYQVTLGSDPGEDHTIRVSYRAELTGFYTNLGLMDEEEKPQGLYSVVTGIGCSAVGANSFAGGQNTYVSGENSFGYGYGASDSDRLEVRGKHSGAIGTNSVVYGNNCGAIGTGLKVSGDNSFAIGSYGSHGSAVAFSIGNGTSNSNRTNAFWVGKTGNVGIAGRLFSSTSALGSDRRALFVRDTSEGSVTVGAGTTNNFSINISKTNYTPWAIYGLYSSSASCNVYRWYMDGNNFVGRVYNPGTSNITVNLTVYVSYIATSAL